MSEPAPTLPASEPAPLAVEVVELEAVRVAVVRSVVAPEDVPAFMSDALALVAETLGTAGVSTAGPPFARYFSMEPAGLDMAAGFPVGEPFLGSGIVRPDDLPAGPAAVATHIGPWAGLEAAWAEVRRRTDEMGRRRARSPWEVYFVGPGSGVDEAAWRTELIWPLAPGNTVTGGPVGPAEDASGA